MMLKYFTAIVALSTCLTGGLILTLFNAERQKFKDAWFALSTDEQNLSVGESINVSTSPNNRSLFTLDMTEEYSNPANETEIIVRNRQRKQLVARFCSNQRRRRSVQVAGPLKHFLHSNRFRFAYCEIGKVASTSWRGALKQVMGDRSGSRKSEKFHPLFKVNRGDRHFKFLFVRHPFDRLISAYTSKFLKRTDYWDKLAPRIIRKYRVTPRREPGITFDEFVRYVIDVPASSPHDDFHWFPQSMVCQPCRIRYDFVGHYETLLDDAEYVLRRLGVARRVRFPGAERSSGAGNVTHAERTMRRMRKYFATLKPTEIARLKRVYRFDFDMFGYNSNIYASVD